MIGIVLTGILVLALAWANGANDVAKGVATLAGSNTTSYRRAILWGTLCTLLGGVAAILWGGTLLKTFGSDFLSTEFHVTLPFVAGALTGACFWISLASYLGWPVSTTHALLGGIVGAVLTLAGPEGLQAAAVANKALLPLLLSPLLAIMLCGVILLLARFVAARIPPWRPGCCAKENWQKNPFICRENNLPRHSSARRERLWTSLHWISSGTTSFARGLNDVPKIAAFLFLALSLLPDTRTHLSQWSAIWPIMAVTLAMALGSLWGGFKVLRLLAHRITELAPASGLAANISTSLLVLAATPLGLSVSTTHVSTGSLMGIRWAGKSQPTQTDALKLVLMGWVITFPLAAAGAAAATYTLSFLV